MVDIAADIEAATDSQVANRLAEKLDAHQHANRRAEAYFTAAVRIEPISALIPARIMARAQAAAGFAQTVVDAHADRLEWRGWQTSPDAHDDLQPTLDAIARANSLPSELHLAFVDACVFGTAFLRTSAGDTSRGEPPVLITAHSPTTTTGVWSPRTRRLEAAMTRIPHPDHDAALAAGGVLPERVVIDRPNSQVTMDRIGPGGAWTVVDRLEHGLGRVLVRQLVDSPRASRPGGRSRITPVVRWATRDAIRTLTAMTANRESYSMPQLLFSGLDADMFEDFIMAMGGTTDVPAPQSAGQQLARIMSSWRTTAGVALGIPTNESGGTPNISQIQTSDPSPFIRQVEALARVVSGATGVPPHYFGLSSDNPTSAEAIAAQEGRLVQTVERMQTAWGREIDRGIADDALAVHYDGRVPEGMTGQATSRWRRAATPSRAADADWTLKLVSAGVLPPTSRVVLEALDLTPEQVDAITAERSQDEGRAALGRILADTQERASRAIRQTTTTPGVRIPDTVAAARSPVAAPRDGVSG